jgi:tRNA threonylcarbamoyladenosine biosynthesis protein TsaE
MSDIEYKSLNPEMTLKLGEILGRNAEPGDVFLLVGNLGSGKTCLTQGIARGLDIKAHVVSPTFVLVREYHGRLPLYHADLYRLENVNEIADLGLDEYLDAEGLCVIEWAEKGKPVLPGQNLVINISYQSENERQFVLHPSGKRYTELLKKVSREL